MTSLHLYPRTGPPPFPDPTTLPTTPLQTKGLVALFLFPSLSILIVAARMYSRVTTRTTGLGKTSSSCVPCTVDTNLSDDYLILGALVSRAIFGILRV
jgi:hypothetical protein